MTDNKESMMNNKLLVAFLSVVFISACSKKTEELSELSSTDPTVAADVARIEASADHQTNTRPVVEQKPEVILNTQLNTAEATRRMVREASVNFSVQDVVKASLMG